MTKTKTAVIFVLPSFKTGGGNRVLFSIANELSKASREVTLIAPASNQPRTHFFIEPNIVVKEVGTTKKGAIYFLFNLYQLIRTTNSQYKTANVVISDPIQCLFIWFFSSKKLIRFVQADDYNMYNDLLLLKNRYVLKVFKLFTWLSYRKKITYIFNSRFSHAQYVKYAQQTHVPYNIVHPAVDHTIFKPNPIRKHTNQPVSISLIARKHPLKGLHIFLKAWGLINERVKSKIGTVTLISHDDLSNLEIPETFLIIKPENDETITETLSNTDIFISTSFSEGFGLPALEAMACGCAVITSISKGCDEYAEPGINCLTYEPEDIEMLVSCITQLAMNEELRKQLINNGIQTAGNFSWEESGKKFEALLL